MLSCLNIHLSIRIDERKTPLKQVKSLILDKPLHDQITAKPNHHTEVVAVRGESERWVAGWLKCRDVSKIS